jgi:hypothetical protein
VRTALSAKNSKRVIDTPSKNTVLAHLHPLII